jgi:amino acid adenylation domain-containing protein/non-ribosomal peptide synthase protein (TIGR01720 family)
MSPVEDIYRLSPMQEGMLFHSLSDKDAGQYVEQSACTLLGDLDPAALRRAWQGVLARHSVLRASFHWEEVDRPVQVVYRAVDLPWREEDWRGLPEEAQAARFEALVDADRRLGFDLDRPPLLRVTLVRLGDRAWRFLWSHHHLLLDGWSLSRVLQDVFAGYSSSASLLPVRPYVDYIAWLEQQDLAGAEAFWRRALDGFTTPTPLPLAAAAAPAARTAARGVPSYEEQVVLLPPAAATAVEEAARRAGVTLGTLVQGAWGLLLARTTGEDDVVFGAVVSGRPPHLRGSESMVGLFINTLPVRVRVGERERLADWLRRLQEQLLELRGFEHSPLAQVQKWSGVRPGEPLFQTLVAFENYPRDVTLLQGPDGLELRDLDTFERTNYPLNFAAVPLDGLQLRVIFDRRLYDPETVERLLGHLRTLLQGMAAGLERPLEELSLLDEAESRRLLLEWNGPAADVPDVTIDVLLERAARERLDEPAVVGADGAFLTYGELFERAGRLAARLRGLGVGPEVPVGLCLERSPDLIAAMIGVWKAGGAYVPLDPEYPAERLRFLIEDSGIPVLVTRAELAAHLPVPDGCEVVMVEEAGRGRPSPGGREGDGRGDGGEGSAYVIYTSGSTGRPKGVVVRHRGAVNFLLEARRLLDLGPQSRVAQTTSPSFDASVLEIFPTLLAGGSLFLLPRDTLLSGPGLVNELRRLGITAVAVVPSLLATLPAGSEGSLPALRTVLVGAERCPAETAARWSAGRRFVNAYGPTELSVFATAFVGAGEPSQGPPIGRPIANTEVYVVDRLGRPVPVGVAGEVWLGGMGVTRGYLARPDLTAERFVPHPFARRPGARVYRTGDLARWQPDGDLEFLGRIDHQIKIRGHRVECGEVEAALARHPGVREAAVIGRDEPGGLRLAACIVPEATRPEPGELRRFLAESLPAAMVPTAWVFLDALPLTPAGKIDRRALARLKPETEPLEEGGAPRSPAAAALARIWAEVLRVERVGVEDDFFDLGGDSILSIQVVARAAEAGLQITPRQVFEHPTVAALAEVAVATGGESGIVAVEGPAPLTPVQRALFERAPADLHHFDMAVLLLPREPLDPGRLERALGVLLDRHDALRLRFESRDGQWSQRVEGPGGPPPWTRIDLSALPEQETAFTAAAAALQASLDLGRVVVRAVFFTGGRDRLLLVLHHLTVDAVSWRVLLEDFERSYLGGEQARLPPPTTPFARWAERLEAYAGSPEAAREIPFWRAQAVSAGGLPRLPIDFEHGPDVEGTSRSVTLALDPQATRALLKDAHRAYQTRVDELLLAALARAFAGWTGQPLWVDVEGHGREPVFTGSEGIDLSRTVGWFTSVHPVLLDLSGVQGPGEVVKTVKERLRRIPNRGLGWGVLRYLTPLAPLSHRPPPDRERGETNGETSLAAGGWGRPSPGGREGDGRGDGGEAPPPEVSFNYLGQIDLLLGGSALFDADPEPPGLPRSPRAARPYRFEVNVWMSDGRLRLHWGYGGCRYRTETVERLAEGFLAALRELIDHCLAPDAGGFTPSDFPAAALDQKSLDRLLGKIGRKKA